MSGRALDPHGREWRCGSCGSTHAGLAYSFAAAAPDAWNALQGRLGPESELGDEQCVINGEHFFVRGLIEIPVKGGEEPVFAWNVWSSLSRDNFVRSSERWDSPDRVNEPAYFGWMSVELAPAYPRTTDLTLRVHTRELGRRPYLEVTSLAHPLAVEQRDGITVERVRRLNELMLHGR